MCVLNYVRQCQFECKDASTYSSCDVGAKVARSEVRVEVGETVSVFMLTCVDYVQNGSEHQTARGNGRVY